MPEKRIEDASLQYFLQYQYPRAFISPSLAVFVAQLIALHSLMSTTSNTDSCTTAIGEPAHSTNFLQYANVCNPALAGSW